MVMLKIIAFLLRYTCMHAYVSIYRSEFLVFAFLCLFVHLVAICECRFTSDVKIKSISVVGGSGGTSPSKMRAYDSPHDENFTCLPFNLS